jgi:hypothetical protein
MLVILIQVAVRYVDPQALISSIGAFFSLTSSTSLLTSLLNDSPGDIPQDVPRS